MNKTTRILARRLAMTCTCLAAISTLGLMTADSGPAIPDEVRDHIRRRVDEGGAAGIVVALIGDGGTTFFSQGSASKGGTKLDEDSVFEIGSITKVFTALLLADAVNAGQVKLDDPVASHLPAEVKFPTGGSRAITLEDLATHRSGLPRLPDNLQPANDQDPYADYTVGRLYDYLGEARLDHDPGTEYVYSNLGAGLLGHVLCLKAGSSYDELVRERLCLPLGMNDTACRPTPAMNERLVQGHADGAPVAGWAMQDSFAGCGGLRSNARDMARFISACLGQGGDTLKPLLDRALETRKPTGIATMEVALGWHFDTQHGVDIVWHNGGTGGFHSFCGFRKDQKLGVVVLSNCADDIDDLGRHLLEPQSPLKVIRPIVSLEAAVLDEYVGYYELKPGVFLRFFRLGTGLQAQVTGESALPVFAEAKDRFFYKIGDVRIDFERDAEGKVHRLTVKHWHVERSARRVPPDQEPKPRTEVVVETSILKDYVGRYELIPGTVFDVRFEADQLTAQLTSQPRFPIFAESPTKFFYKIVDAQLTFVRDEQGQVTGLILHQFGMDQTAKRVE